MTNHPPRRLAQRRRSLHHDEEPFEQTDITSIPNLGMVNQQEGQNTNDAGEPVVSTDENGSTGPAGDRSDGDETQFPPPPIHVESPTGVVVGTTKDHSAPTERELVILEEGHKGHDCRSNPSRTGMTTDGEGEDYTSTRATSPEHFGVTSPYGGIRRRRARRTSLHPLMHTRHESIEAADHSPAVTMPLEEVTEVNSTYFQLDPEFDVSTAFLLKLFNALDSDGNGRISYDEMKMGLTRLQENLHTDPNLPDQNDHELLALLHEIDTDGSHDLNQAEFVKLIQEFACRTTTATGTFHEAFFYDYGPDVARCRYITPERKKDTIGFADFFEHDIPLTEGATVRWVHISGDSPAVLLRVSNKYGLTQLETEDMMNDRERPKVEETEVIVNGDVRNRIQILLNTLRVTVDGKLKNGEHINGAIEFDDPTLEEDLPSVSGYRLNPTQLNMFVIDDKRILTIEHHPSALTNILQSRLLLPASKIRLAGHYYLVYALVDTIVDLVFPITKTVQKDLKLVQKKIYSHERTSLDTMKRCTEIQRELHELQQYLKPLATVVQKLQVQFKDQKALTARLNDVRDHVESLQDFAVNGSNWARSLNDIYINEQQYRMNQVMYTLTLVTSIFIPAQFLTGVFGMNFEHMPELNWRYSYAIFWGGVLMISLCVYAVFRKRGWLSY